MAAHPLALAQLPLAPGIYRLRRVDCRLRLHWIGWANTGVREVVERLSRQVHLPIEPYDDPGSPAHSSWNLRHAHAVSFEVSGAAARDGAAGGSAYEREAREAYQGLLPAGDRVGFRSE